MTDEQLKTLAALVLAHDERLLLNDERFLRIIKLADRLVECISPVLPAGSEWKNGRPITETLIERQEALSRDANEIRKNLRKFFGLD
jgi:hypothetical protein